MPRTSGRRIAVDYVKDGSVLRVTAKRPSRLYNTIIPYIATELPPAQKAALANV